MGRIAVIVMEKFEETDYLQPSEFLKNEGHEIVHVGLKRGMTIEGRRKEIRVRVDEDVKDVSAEAFDAVLIPRGYTLDEVTKAKDIVELVEDFLEKGKPVWRSTTIRRMTANPS
ncbi:MAG TPA: DJ-1/PfpI family protein [Thermodesulfobacteriota bacterium]|nr:DJ-1/PfpI family protein [Thermodesulfobacteriota bacterium]